VSYLHPVRLHFAGRFLANVSTVNNDPGHFDNAAFQPSFQQMQTAEAMNGWFNPQGDGGWRLMGCRVTSAWSASSLDRPVRGDPVLGLLVADADDATSAKLVDLDPEQQMVSTIFGLQVRLADPDGVTVLRSNYEPAAFIDIWDRALTSSGGDAVAGAMYQSVLTDLQWGDVSASPFLVELQQAAADGLLSIKFNIDGINMNFKSPDFMSGRIVGTIGPATKSEPQHFVVGRQFMATEAATSRMFTPNGSLNFCVATVDATASTLMIDLGNALQSTTAGGPLADVGDLVATVPLPNGTTTTLATLKSATYRSDGWYDSTAGIVVAHLSADQLAAVADNPISIMSTQQRPGARVYISEDASGAFARADGFVLRMSPGDTANVNVHASLWGAPVAGATISLVSDDSQLQPGNYIGGVVPPVSTPPTALTYPATVVTDANGLAVAPISGTDPGQPRDFANGAFGIDGQVYGIRPSITQLVDGSVPGTTTNPWNFVSVLLWSAFDLGHDPTWVDLGPIFTQYANLYPVMSRFVDLTSYDSVVAYAWLLQFAFALDERNPNTMPVTRDLSPAKRAAILKWLGESPPPRGTPPLAAAAVDAAGAAGETVPADLAKQGGKTAAAARRRARLMGGVAS